MKRILKCVLAAAIFLVAVLVFGTDDIWDKLMKWAKK